MEPLLSADPKKTKERILSFLLVFLILLVPISILTDSSQTNVDITGLHSEGFNLTAQRVFIKLQSYTDQRLRCKLKVEFFRHKILVDKYFKDVGDLSPNGELRTEFILNTPSGENEFEISPECWSIDSGS